MTKSKRTGAGASAAEAEDEHVDGCVEDVALSEGEATLDVELPPARGGVEPAQPPS